MSLFPTEQSFAPLTVTHELFIRHAIRRARIRRQDPGTSTRIHKSRYLPTFKLNIKKLTSVGAHLLSYRCPPGSKFNKHPANLMCDLQVFLQLVALIPKLCHFIVCLAQFILQGCHFRIVLQNNGNGGKITCYAG